MGLKKSSRPAVKKATKTRAPKSSARIKTGRKAPAMKKGGTKPKSNVLSSIQSKGRGVMAEALGYVPLAGPALSGLANKKITDDAKRSMGIPVHKRINPLNPKASSRALRRMKGFVNKVKPMVKALGYTLQRHKAVKLKGKR